ncbi:hypothetical protein M011DRAFT_466537 [Sporormia fimetaria CBS 119925]|uniref:Uncharacterized protein n=1 Tax=Sporormia fimetaria CBS 119925 TaxID=1340428 RepID=A0A6A6VDS5_9PLEO|nr:hypothetical protein M011DRAFT_466537 [Sporormia fimetaria CBS 119925]
MRDSEEDDNISLSDLKPSSAQDSLLPPSQPRSSPDGEKRPREKKKTYEVWGVAFICLLAGMALGALFGERTAQRRQGGKGQGEYEGERVMMAPFGMLFLYGFEGG